MQRILVLGVFCVFCLVGLALPLVFRGHVNSERTEAINNAKQVGLALFEFDQDFGSYPDAATIPSVKTATSTGLSLGTSSSNEIFRQLLANGLKSEKIFWAKSAISPRTPDDVILGTKALEKGECSFAYVAGLSTSSDPSTPLLMAPVDPSGRCFERRDDYGERAVILFLDGAAKTFPINKHGQVELNGMDLFDPRQPFWRGTAPDIKWPE